MSVVKLVREFLALPSIEQKRFLRAVRAVKWPDVESRAQRITGGRVLPNLVLAEREESAY